jgi:superfamily I DNA and/or RNA helicase
MYEEDIFNDEALKVVVRFYPKFITSFDKNNSLNFARLKSILGEQNFDCYFLKLDDEIQKIIIPIETENGQLELHVKWDKKTFSYVGQVHKNKKTIFNPIIQLPKEKPTFIKELCQIKFIDFDDTEFPERELYNLYQRVSQLETTSKVDINQQQEIWDKYIEAQELIISKLQEPFEIVGYRDLKSIKDQKGDDVFKYMFQVDLKKAQKKKPYLDVEAALKELNIDASFDENGEVKLKFDDIFRGLDAVINRDFSEIIAREEKIGAILKVYPEQLQDKIQKRLNAFSLDVAITSSERQKKVYLNTVNPKQKRFLIKILEKEFDLNFSYYKYEIEILNHGDIVENKRINRKYHLTFGKQYSKSADEPERLMPFPIDNIFTIRESECYEIYGFINSLKSIYSNKNVLIKTIDLIFKCDEDVTLKPEFDADFWQDLKRDLYPYGLENNFYESSSSIFLEFKTEEEFKEQLDLLRDLNKFNINYNPEGYEFKIKTNLLSEENEKAIFDDKLEKLRGVEFMIELPSEKRYKDRISIGKLVGHESNLSKLVFSLANHWKEDKENAKKLIKYLDDKPEINLVQANLIGDKVKTGWLKDAMKKITAPTNKPNGKTINEKLGEFIFDASKASPILKDISETSIDWQTAKKHQLLRLNDSQLKAILSALNAEDLALLQGPPGTGKTTVIAELIWQMIRKNPHQRILLTSETNLAVDNALERLLNKEHSLVKPLRFGKPHKFEEEGRKYAYSRIIEWIDGKYENKDDYENAQLEEIQEDELENEKEDVNNNAVQRWMNRIAEKAQRNANLKYADVLKDWTMEMAYPTKDMKTIFKDKYLKYANVVGSTCSSCGSRAFNKDYQNIFNSNLGQDSAKVVGEIIYLIDTYPDSNKIWRLLDSLEIDCTNYTKEDFPAIKEDLAKIANITFDAVIMDEASKATPPELLLPLCFGKKSVIIGDHRQLPPMIHDKDFRETLEELDDEKATQLAKEINRKFVETSQFERMILNPKVHKSIKATFNIQYRMHPKINDVIKQFYLDEGGLECGLDSSMVDIKDLNEPQSRHHGLFYPNFIDHDTHTIWIDVNKPEQKEGTSRINTSEIEAINKVFELLKESNGFEAYQNHWKAIKDVDKSRQEQEIGLISFYGKQVNELKSSKRKAQQLGIPVRLKTVDKFQGMERNIVIVSTVRSDKLKSGNKIIQNRDIGFAKSPQRLNVALSRARRLLIVVGNKDFFYKYKNPKGEAIYKNAINEIRQNGKIISYENLMNL